jgi:hypothetical protein
LEIENCKLKIENFERGAGEGKRVEIALETDGSEGDPSCEFSSEKHVRGCAWQTTGQIGNIRCGKLLFGMQREIAGRLLE